MRIANETNYNATCTYPLPITDEDELDVDAIVRNIPMLQDEGGVPGIHGTDIFDMDLMDVAKIIETIDDSWDESPWVQTDPTLINPIYTDMFNDYDVRVNIVSDGPPHLTDRYFTPGEWSDGTPQGDINPILSLVENGIETNVIIPIHSNHLTPNGTRDLIEWYEGLTQEGVNGALNPTYPPKGPFDVNEFLEDLQTFYSLVWKWVVEEPSRTLEPMNRFTKIFNVHNTESQIPGYQGPFATPVPIVIRANGFVTTSGGWNGKSKKKIPQYIDYVSEGEGVNLRSEALGATLMENGGCGGCEYWGTCNGGHVVDSKNTHWEEKTFLCEVYKDMFDRVEKHVKSIGLGRLEEK